MMTSDPGTAAQPPLRNEAAAAGKRKRPRTCVGCGAVVRAARDGELVRLVLGPDGDVVVDLAGRSFGRGAWVHPARQCVEGAARRGLARSFKQQVKVSVEVLSERLELAVDRRVTGLLGAAVAARKVAAGHDMVAEAVGQGQACLVLLARDARAAATASWLEPLGQQGLLQRWGDKQTLGAALSRSDTAVIAVLDDGLASALSSALNVARQLASNESPSTDGFTGACVEVST